MDWKEAHKVISDLLKDFQIKHIELSRARNKKDKKIREEAMQVVNNQAKRYIKGNAKLCELFAGNPLDDPLGYTSVWDEFHKPNFFESDMITLLADIEKQIAKSAEN